jgi:hypothetical protein
LLYLAATAATADSPQVAAAAVEPLKPERNLAQAGLVVQAWQSLRLIFKMDEDWIILIDEEIINTIRWNGDPLTWPLPESAAAVRRSEFALQPQKTTEQTKIEQ